MKKKYLNLLTISCGVLLMSVPAGYAAEGDEGGWVAEFDTSLCPSGHYYQSIACHMAGGRPSPDAPEVNCRCIIEGDEWGHWYCCDATSTGGGGGGGHGGHFNWHIIPSGNNNNNGSGCSGLTGTQRQCCEAGFTQHGTTPLYGCPSGKAFMGECPYNSFYWRCLDYADACEVMGYSTSISSCPSGKQKMGCPYSIYLTDKYYKCRDIPCYGKELCGPGTTGCKNGEQACVKNGGIYCSPGNCKANVGGGNGTTCSATASTDIGARDLGNDGFINCSTDGMRNCDALGYLQNDKDCPSNGDRLTCPFDNNRFYCGGKIANNVTNGAKPCYLSNVVGGATTTTAIAIGTIQPNNVSDCQSYSNIIPLYNACIRRACAKECYLVKTSEYCVTEYSTALYKLQCDESRESSAECQDDVEAESDSDD